MNNRKQLLLVVATAVLFLFGTMAFAQGQQVQITKGPVVEHTTADSAIVAWSTNESASTVVKYGTDPNNLNQTAQAPWGGLTHRVTIKNLEPGKTYYFQVTSGQAQGGGNAMGQVATFTTQAASGASNATPANQGNVFKIVNGPNIENVADTTAVIAWTTDRPSSSIVKYGTDPNNLNQMAEEPWGATTHRVTVKNLQPGTQYYFSVHSAQGKNAPGQAADTQPMPFTTRANGQPASSGGGMAQNGKDLKITNGPVLEHVADTNAVVAWSTDRPASSIVKYGTDRNNLSQTAEVPWGATTHRVELKNLKPNTQYFVQVMSAQGKNAPGQHAQSDPVPFTTAAAGQQAKK